ncbi:16S rRNA (adenine(1518)-N(6)/adenine(1519)-N(6))-dimethyltransferase RsmA [Hyphobacterium marinum]|uniref:Ribosomal RNA small subunit methyltransferase A n=1 Tax=Hyphobacterium marinum TaxID=3116574 RepID=A0ABU7M065_9PROT|nr:16S rRNA (adenine(1518)-N(6)/adenine(1519)-N(6))-dimethyltransferase RsmA [Hyphobacterium sp. Y6023]MEE2567188.1 16S rRNA (adenine(1518)-N(6)/adenine(1519)-N(6))-dimethyltransferase RsmA [Hyphobacterium sp. Y6023]
MSIDLPPLRALIAEHGLGADKSFGQHFLLDLNLTAKIASLAGDLSGKTVIEIGPGPGGLTRALLAAGPEKMIAVEMDRRFIPALEVTGEAFPAPLDIVEGDALTVDDAALAGPGAVIASNLPYNVGTALLIKWLRAEPVWWDTAVLMFQREVADRVVARPGEKAYGRLAVITAARATALLALKVPARAFTPPPKVESAVVVLHPLPVDRRFTDITALETITESAFGQRRKMLRSSLKTAAAKAGTSAEALLSEAGIEPTARAETIAPEGFMELARAWRAARG